jgi:hypothetical protein
MGTTIIGILRTANRKPLVGKAVTFRPETGPGVSGINVITGQPFSVMTNERGVFKCYLENGRYRVDIDNVSYKIAIDGNRRTARFEGVIVND